MQADEGIEHEQARLQPGDGLVETCAIGVEIKPQAGCGDHLDVEFRESSAGGGTDAFEAATDDVQSIFGGIEQDMAGTAHREAAQAGDAGGNGNGQIEGEEGFPAEHRAGVWIDEMDLCEIPGGEADLQQGEMPKRRPSMTAVPSCAGCAARYG